MKRATFIIQVMIALFLFAATTRAQEQSLETVLRRAGERATALHVTAPVLVADEVLTQILKPYGSSQMDFNAAAGSPLGEMGLPQVRRSKGTYAIVSVPDTDGWYTYRDIFEADGKAVHKEKDRLPQALTAPFADAVTAARTITEAALKLNVGKYPRDVSLSMFPWTVVYPSNQKRCTFTRKGEKQVGGVKAVEVQYVETEHPTLGRTLDGVDKPSRGTIWIDPQTGVLVKATVVFDSLDAYPDMKLHPERYAGFPRVQIDITYREDATVKTWVPVEVKELFSRPSEVITCTATYTNFRRIEVKQ